MTSLFPYYLSRVLISLVLGSLLTMSGLHWGIAVLVGAMALAFFLWAPQGGRYVLKSDQGVTPLRRDEYTQAVNNKSARSAFVVTLLALAGAAIYYNLIAPSDVPIAMLNLTCALGVLTYGVSDWWYRR